MKKFAVIMVIVLFLLTGCAVGGESDYPAAITVENTVYFFDPEPVAGEVDEKVVIGYTKYYTDEYPTRNGECNFNRELGMPYAKVEEGLAVLYENEWYICRPEK